MKGWTVFGDVLICLLVLSASKSHPYTHLCFWNGVYELNIQRNSSHGGCAVTVRCWAFATSLIYTHFNKVHYFCKTTQKPK